MPAPPPVTEATLAAFSDAWNRHDIDALMSFMSDDCVFLTAAGPDACGTRVVGAEAVRKAFAAAWATVPDAQWRNGVHAVHGDAGTSMWTFTGTAADGTRIEVDGIDVFRFRDGKIVEIRLMMDGMSLMRQLGVMPAQTKPGLPLPLLAMVHAKRLTQRVKRSVGR